MELKTILITGVAGFIGYSLTKKLLEYDTYKIIGIDNLNDYYDVSLKKERIRILMEYSKNFIFYKEDIENETFLEKLFISEPLHRIIHLAAQAGVRYSIENPKVYIQSNLVGFFNILELSRKNTIPLIYASSSSVYGNNNSEFIDEEMDTSRAISLYAATKKSNEVMAHSYSHLFKIPTIGLRFFTVYGPWGRPDMALFKFTKNILDGKQIDVYNRGEMHRDFTYISDIVEGILSALELDINSYKHEIFNLGCGNTRKLNDFITILSQYCGKEAIINYMPIQPGDVLRTSANISKSSNILNFKPKINIEEGLKLFVDWYKSYYVSIP